MAFTSGHPTYPESAGEQHWFSTESLLFHPAQQHCHVGNYSGPLALDWCGAADPCIVGGRGIVRKEQQHYVSFILRISESQSDVPSLYPFNVFI